MDIRDMSVEELENLAIDLTNERQKISDSLAVVKVRYNNLATAMARLDTKRKEMKNGLDKAKSSIYRINTDLDNIKTVKWQKLREQRGI